MNIILIYLTVYIEFVYCGDFNLGMFKRNDFLVAQDTLLRGAKPHSYTYAKYGRLFKCPITYFKMVDRLGMGQGPTLQVVRGGLMKKFIVVRIRSTYNLPISVNIYVGCANKAKTPRWKRPTRTSTTTGQTKPASNDDATETNDDNTTSQEPSTDNTSLSEPETNTTSMSPETEQEPETEQKPETEQNPETEQEPADERK